MTVERQNILSTIMLKMSNFPMEMSDFTWLHQKYIRLETYVVPIIDFILLKSNSALKLLQDTRSSYKLELNSYKKL